MIILHSEAQGRQNFAHAAHWREGFMLAPPGGGLARIEFNGSDRRDATRCVGFDIQVASHQPREIWAVFAEALNHLIHDLERHYGYTSIVVKRLVSCPAQLCQREAAQRYYIEETHIASLAQSGENWREQTTVCTPCGRVLPLGLLWDGRSSEDPGRWDRIEGKLDRLAESEARHHDETCDGLREVGKTVGSLQRLRADLEDICVRLAASALASEGAASRILNGQDELAKSLRQDMERVCEEANGRLRQFIENQAEPASDLPRLYTLKRMGRWERPFLGRRKWRLWLYCEKTRLPVAPLRRDGQGEFVILECQEFLRAVAPYVRTVSTLLATLGPVAVLLSGASPIVAVVPAAAIEIARWAKESQQPFHSMDSYLREAGIPPREVKPVTGSCPVTAEREALLWLHNFLRGQPGHVSRLGLVQKVDGQGRHWWVLPEVEL
jgi:hypothetical protein